MGEGGKKIECIKTKRKELAKMAYVMSCDIYCHPRNYVPLSLKNVEVQRDLENINFKIFFLPYL
jgi:hypothetical protein